MKNIFKHIITLFILFTIFACDNRDFDEDLVSISPINFELSLTSQNPNIYFNEKAKLHFKLTPEFVSDMKPNSFKVLYLLEAGEGTLFFRGKEYSNGDEIIIDYPDFPVNEEEVYFKPTSLKDKNYIITLSAKDNTGATKIANQTIDIKERNFNFLATKITHEKLFINEAKGKIRLDLISEGNPEGMGYNLTFTSSGTGKMYYEGEEYLIGQNIPIKHGMSEIEYLVEDYNGGKHDINFIVKDATNKIKTQDVQLEVYKTQ